MQNTFRYLASRKIKQIAETSTRRALHKRRQYNLKQIKTTLEQNNLKIAKADKGRTVVIIHKDILKQKVETFIHDNHITQLQKDPTELFQKQIQQTLQICNTIIDKNQHKYLLQIKPTVPALKALIKILKDNETIRPVINNIQTPSYKLSKHLNKKLNQMILLPYTYVTRNSNEVVQDLHNIQIKNQHKMLTLDIKDLYVNLSIQNIVSITKFWLNKHNNQHIIITQTLELNNIT